MSGLKDWCAAHIDKPGVAEPLLKRALDGIRKIERLAEELRAERHRHGVLSDQLAMEVARARNAADRLDEAAAALAEALAGRNAAAGAGQPEPPSGAVGPASGPLARPGSPEPAS